MIKLVLLILAGMCCAAHAAALGLAGAGKYPVGFRVVEQYDYSRAYRSATDLVTGQPYTGERARPVQTLIWYPAAAQGRPMAYRDYFDTLGAEDDFSASAADKARRIKAELDMATAGPRAAPAQQALAAAMTASRDAAARQGRFPAVVYGPSFGTAAMDNADLCEYLASHGYVVIASPSVGARSRAMTKDLDGLEAQAADMAFLAGFARSLPNVDAARIGVMGYSWGGLANVLAAARDDRIGAVVSLDGSVRAHSQYVDGSSTAARYVLPERLTAPMLYVGARPHSAETINKHGLNISYSLLNKMVHADTYILTMNPMSHSDFDSFMLRFAPDESFDQYTREEATLAYSWAARYVRRFLDTYLKGDPTGKAFLMNKPVANGVPPRLMVTDIRLAASPAPTLESLAAELGRTGFANAIAAYNRITARQPAFTLAPRAISQWGGGLLERGKAQDARHIFALGVHLYPADAGMMDGLAAAHLALGQRDEAARSFRRGLELEPQNAERRKQLLALESR
ncbi:dienelactone hydrolase family protein [Massilia sp. PAMC28688]|uniref:dienelactone hydrolase family protein n=1 Tax=Massilia sp. PAMC28688 TaxID=2861283 RepID=UPI001C62A081|nr:dienelactone hydrolase family protein [Massilia sp. PAMC28688]QYF94154.1 dienelactone hydrolase family protein [Massilia sp. PAMC28688]